MKKHLHWTQTPAGRKRQSELQKARWAAIRNGGGVELDELKLMEQILNSFGKLPQHAKDYVRAKIG